MLIKAHLYQTPDGWRTTTTIGRKRSCGRLEPSVRTAEEAQQEFTTRITRRYFVASPLEWREGEPGWWSTAFRASEIDVEKSKAALDALQPAFESLQSEGYVFPMGGGVHPRKDGSVDFYLATSDDQHFEQTVKAAAPDTFFRFQYNQQNRHAVFRVQPSTPD